MGAAHLHALDWLRGLAALSVGWFHFTQGNGWMQPGWLTQSGQWGWLGVEAFFVISGFVIPYAMREGRYAFPRDGLTFMAKRMLRLTPPYLVAAGLAIVLWWMSSKAAGFQGAVPSWSASQLLAHLLYLNDLVGLPWLVPVFWSLAIEMQFYIAMAVVFPLVNHARFAVRLGFLLGWCALALIQPGPAWLAHYAPLFAFGFVAFWRRVSLVSTAGALWLIALLLPAVAFAPGLSGAEAGVGAAVALVIVFWQPAGSATGARIGGLSYAFYLVHVPVGGRVVNLGGRWPAAADSVWWQWGVAVTAVAVSLGVAWLLWRCVEMPAQRWSARLRYAASPTFAGPAPRSQALRPADPGLK